MPLNKKLRKNKLEEIKQENKTIILYEAPHKISQTLKDLCDELGNVNIVIARELTKIHEEFIRGKINDIINNYPELKGEIIILIEGNSTINSDEQVKELLNSMTLEEHYNYYKNKDYSKKEIIKKIAKDRNANKNDIYMKLINFE